MGLWAKLFGSGFQRHRQRGQRYQLDGDLGLARSEYETAMGAAEGAPEADVQEVREALAAVRLRLSEQRLDEGRELATGGFLDEAEDSYQLALELADQQPQQDAARAALRALEEERVRQREVEAELPPEGDEFMGSSPEERLEIFLLGLADPAQAEEYRSLGPEFASAVLQLHEGAAAAAIEGLEALRAAGVEHPLLDLELGRALLFAGDAEHAEQAAELLRPWARAHPADIQANAALADALRQAGQPDEAGAILVELAERNPPESAAMQHLAEHCYAVEDWEGLVETAREGLRHVPRSLELKRLLGLGLHAAGHSAEATGLLEQVLQARWRYDEETDELEFDRGTAWVVARIYVQTGGREQLERAHGLLRALDAHASAAERPLLLASQAEVLLRLGQPDAGRRLAEKARALLDPEAPADPALAQRLDALTVGPPA